MIQLVLVYDDEDYDPVEQAGLGYFFKACAIHLKRHIDTTNKFLLIEIASDILTEDTVPQALQNLQGGSFILLAYSHGKADALLYKNQTLAYLSAEEHKHLLRNSLFYTWACSCGTTLGPQAVEEGCRAFIGYTDIVVAGSWLIDEFVDAANYGLLAFLNGATVEQAQKDMIANYNRHIDATYKQSFMVAGFLRRNRNALVFLTDDKTLTLNRMATA